MASPRPLELFDRHREGCRDVRDAAELDGEIGRGDRVGRLEDRERVRLPEEPEELMEDDVRRDLRVLEHPGRLFELPRDHLQLGHEQHRVTPRRGFVPRYLTVCACCGASMRWRRTWIREDCATVVPRIRSENRWRGSPSTRSPAIVSRSGNRNQNSFGTFRTAAFPRVIGPATARTSSPAIVLPTVFRQIPSATVAYAKNTSPDVTPYAVTRRSPRRNRTDHTGARTTMQSIANATTRFAQWIWRVRFWPMMSNPFTMSASRSRISGERIRK